MTTNVTSQRTTTTLTGQITRTLDAFGLLVERACAVFNRIPKRFSDARGDDFFEEPTTMTLKRIYSPPSSLSIESLPTQITLLFCVLVCAIGLYLIDAIFGIWLYELPVDDLRRAARMIYESGMMDGVSDTSEIPMSEENAAYLRNTLYRTYLARVAWGLTSALALVLTIGIYLRSYTRRNTRALLEFAKQIGESNWDAQLEGSLRGEFRHLGESMLVMKNQLAAYEKQRSAMVDRIAHDVRNPLSTIRTLASLQPSMPQDRNGNGPSNIQNNVDTQYWQWTDACAVQMSRLLDDLSYLARSDTSDAYQPSENAATDIVTSIEKVVAYYEASRGNRVRFNLSIPADKLPPIAMDFTRLSQILGNLLDNALEHGQATDIGITIEQNSPHSISLRITDNGQGMSERVQSRIFEAGFSTSKGKANHQGLGMAIVTEIVQAHNGTIDVRSRPGRGTAFEMTLPTLEISYL